MAILSFCACRAPWLLTPAQVESVPSPVEMKHYQHAVAIFKNGQYAEAVQLFEDIRTKTTDKRFALMALHGLANAKLMAAETPEEYKNALLLWRNWVENVSTTFEYEDPSLVDALIQDKMLFSNIPLTSEDPKETDKESMVSRWLLIESKLELDRVRNELTLTKKTSEKRKKKIGTQEKRIGELKRQIKAMETIDQKIQKKKKTIPSADSATQR